MHVYLQQTHSMVLQHVEYWGMFTNMVCYVKPRMHQYADLFKPFWASKVWVWYLFQLLVLCFCQIGAHELHLHATLHSCHVMVMMLT